MTDFSKHDDVPAQDAAPPVPPQGPPPEPGCGPAVDALRQPPPGPHDMPGPPYPPPAPPAPPYGYGYGYGQGPLPYPPPPLKPPTSTAMWTHLGALLTLVAGSSVCCLGWALAWIAPLVIRTNERNRHDPFIRHHAAQAINYGITSAIVGVLGIAGYGAGIAGVAMLENDGPVWVPFAAFGLLALAVLHTLIGLIFSIIGCTKASGGHWWSYPRIFALPFVKS